jgi:hypothetical protein
VSHTRCGAQVNSILDPNTKKKQLENLGVDGNESWRNKTGLDSSGLRQGPVAGSYEYGNEPSGSTEMENFYTEWLSFLRRAPLRVVSYPQENMLHLR